MNPEESSPAAKPSVCYDFSGGYLATSAYALSSGTSAASMGLLARAYSRGGVILGDGRRLAAATVLACNAHTVSLPAGAAVALAAAAQLVATQQAAATDYIVPGGETSTGLALGAGDTMTVLGGGTASSTTVNSGGVLTVSSGGTASSTMVQSGGVQNVASGGHNRQRRRHASCQRRRHGHGHDYLRRLTDR